VSTSTCTWTCVPSRAQGEAGGAEEYVGARIYERRAVEFANLLNMSRLFAKLLERFFSPFAKKIRMLKSFAKLLELLLWFQKKIIVYIFGKSFD
jgi:hypothetical protein